MSDEENKVNMDTANTDNQSNEPAFKAYGFEPSTTAGIPYVFGSVEPTAITPAPDPGPQPPTQSPALAPAPTPSNSTE